MKRSERIKYKARRLGRMIRRITGLPFTTCMGIGKAIAQGKYEYDIAAKYPEAYVIDSMRCGDGCCSYSNHTIRGPRGSISEQYGVGASNITREYELIAKNYIKPPTPRKVRKVCMIEAAPDTVRDLASLTDMVGFEDLMVDTERTPEVQV